MKKGIIPYETTPEIEDKISKIGRTEDIKFSPDNKQFAIAETSSNKIHLFSIEINKDNASFRIIITKYSSITSQNLKYPHGVSFLGNKNLIVCNRNGGVTIFEIPADIYNDTEHSLKPIKKINGEGYIFSDVNSPGSIDVVRIDENFYQTYICNNFWNMISYHEIKIDCSVKVKNKGVLIEKGVKIPEGISTSPNKNWIAISNHVDGNVLIYKNSQNLNRNTQPNAILKGPVCPHGLRFNPNGDKLFVTDASSQYIYYYECIDGNWGESKVTCRPILMIDDATFYMARNAARDGGVKGVDVDNSNAVLLTTHKSEVIGFYNIDNLINEKCNFEDGKIEELSRQRDYSLKRFRKNTFERKWTLSSRIKKTTSNKYKKGIKKVKKIRTKFQIKYFTYKNKFSTNSLIDPSGPIVSLTTYGFRLKKVFIAIESIGNGYQKPSQIILWLNEQQKNSDPPNTLKRLEKRGLEIKYCKDYLCHKKYYPYLESESNFKKAFATADDDVIYPRYWLQELFKSYNTDPSVIYCYRAHKIGLLDKQFLPYNDWQICNDTLPSHENFITGVSGVIYPPEFLNYLKLQGDKFENYCPKNDDIWLTLNAIRSGHKIAQIEASPILFKAVPGTQKESLKKYNMTGGGNQIQLINTFTQQDLEKLNSHLQPEFSH